MDIEKIAQKLEPLAPDEVEHWRKTRELVDPDMKSLLDKQIISLAHRELGNFYNKILLSLPPEKKAQGPIHLGNILYEKEKWELGISLNELNQHLGIFGRSGSGKTNITFHILLQLINKGIKVLFMDWKRTGRHLIPTLKQPINIYTPGRSIAFFPFNPFVIPPGLESNVYINQIIDIMASVYTLGDGAKSLLQKALKACYQRNHAPTPHNLLEEIEQINVKGRTQGWKISVIRALESLVFSNMIVDDKHSQKEWVNRLLQNNTILELDGLDQNSKQFLSATLFLWIYYVKLAQKDREKLDFVIFVDEAHHLLHQKDKGAKETVMEMLLRQCREFGIGFVIVDQHSSLMSKAVLNNLYTSISLNQKSPSDMNQAAGLSMLKEDEKHYLSQLPVGQGIVKLQDRWYQPMLVRFPLVSIEKGVVTDELLIKYLEHQQISTTDSKGKTPELPEFKQMKRIPLNDYTLNEPALQFLQDIIDYPYDGVNVRYKRLGLGVGTANRLKDILIDNGWLETEVVKIGQTRKVLLRLTKQAKQALGLDHQNNNRESLAHEYWKNRYARKFKDKGDKVQMEASRINGRVDVLAVKDNKRIGIEIETGKSDVVSNVKNCLLSKFDQVIVVATDNKAMEKVERLLAKEGLIMPGRIIVEYSDQLTSMASNNDSFYRLHLKS